MKINFQIVIIGVFIILGILGVLVFAGIIPLGSNKDQAGSLGTVVLWGTVKAESIKVAVQDFNSINPTFIVKYVEKDPVTFDKDLLEALATGNGPDMFFLPDNLILSYKNKIFPIPYTSYSTASFKNTFAGAGEVFLNSKGILAFPLAVDPLVMYYNRSILDTNSVVYPPQYWDDLSNLAPILTKRNNGNISISTVALGQFSNITHAKDILSTLFMQIGSSIVTESNGFFSPTLGNNDKTQDLASTLSFYLSFSDPANKVYSWNRGLPNSTEAFSSEDLVFYFGYASELQSLTNKNPNENFSVAPMPQFKNSNFKLTTGRVTGIAVSSFSKNITTALKAATLMAGGDFANQFAKAIGVVPARRDLLAQKPTDANLPVFYDSALFAKAWLDPSPADTDSIFKNMIDEVLSNSVTAYFAINDANGKLSLLLNK